MLFDSHRIKAGGPLPISSTFDHGGELSASHFVISKKLMLPPWNES